MQRLAGAASSTCPAILADLQRRAAAWARGWLDRLGIGDLDALRDRLTSVLVQGEPVRRRPGAQLRPEHAALRRQRRHHALRAVLPVPRRSRRSGATSALRCRSATDYSRRLLAIFAAVVRATVKGNIIIAVIQGTIGGVDLLAARDRGGAALGRADDLPVDAAGGRLGAGLGAGGGLPAAQRAPSLKGVILIAGRRRRDRPRRQPPAPVAGRQGHPAARLRRAGLDGRRHVALRDQRLRHRPADRRAVHRRLDAVPRGAAGASSGRRAA